MPERNVSSFYGTIWGSGKLLPSSPAGLVPAHSYVSAGQHRDGRHGQAHPRRR
jgi:hypothetical protein